MNYKVIVNFGGYFGCDKEYEVDAIDEEDAREQVIDLILDDLNFSFEKEEEDK